jgi:hypothetical protein
MNAIICKQRWSVQDNTCTSTNVSDFDVNQLLSKIDGVDSLNNILLIGIRIGKDMIDNTVCVWVVLILDYRMITNSKYPYPTSEISQNY